MPYRRVHAASLRFTPDWKHDPAAREAAPDLLINRMSPSADRRGHGHGILPDAAVPRVGRGRRRTRDQRLARIRVRDLQGPPDGAAGRPGAPVPEDAGDQRRERGTRRDRGASLAGGGEAERRRQWGRRPALRSRAGPARRGRGRSARFRRRSPRARAGVHSGARWPHHARRGVEPRVSLRDSHAGLRTQLQSVPGRRVRSAATGNERVSRRSGGTRWQLRHHAGGEPAREPRRRIHRAR